MGNDSIQGYQDSRGYLYSTRDMLNFYTNTNFKIEYLARYMGKRGEHLKSSDFRRYYLSGVLEGGWVKLNFDDPALENKQRIVIQDSLREQLKKQLGDYLSVEISSSSKSNNSRQYELSNEIGRYVDQNLSNDVMTTRTEGAMSGLNLKFVEVVSRVKHKSFDGKIYDSDRMTRIDVWYAIHKDNFIRN